MSRPAAQPDHAVGGLDGDRDEARPCPAGRDRASAAGRVVVTVGVLLGLYAMFQVWGTALVEWQGQRALDSQLSATLSAGDGGTRELQPVPTVPSGTGPDTDSTETTVGTESPAGTETTVGTAADVAIPPTGALAPAPAVGAALGRIEIPSIGVSKAVVEGVDRETLRLGPGHYPGTALPGRSGNTAIAGHRTTYGAPFGDLDRLQPGDTISVETADGTFVYVVDGHDGPDGQRRGHRIVDRGALDVVADHGDSRLTLTACHPKFSARQRIVVTALLAESPADAAPTQALTQAPAPDPEPVPEASAVAGDQVPVTTSLAGRSGDANELAELTGPAAATVSNSELESSFGWQPDEIDSTGLWATVSLLIGLTGWALGRRWRRPPAYAITAPLLIPALFLCFVHLDRLLPAF